MKTVVVNDPLLSPAINTPGELLAVLCIAVIAVTIGKFMVS